MFPKTTDELHDYLIRMTAAYRKSYKLLGGIHKALLITGGILTSSGMIALIPAVPVFVAGVTAVPIILTMISQNLKLGEKKEILKHCHKEYKILLTRVRSLQNQADESVLNEIFKRIEEFESSDLYKPPLEMFMRRYELNGYSNGSNLRR